MDKNISKNEISIIMHGKQCKLLIEYGSNPGAKESGFSIYAGQMPFDVECCKTYPMMHAYIDASNLNGYERECGWIQMIIRTDFKDEKTVYEKCFDLDCSEEMYESGLPYFALGYPAEIFDAPCHNLRNNEAKLEWIAHTYLVELPNKRLNGNNVKYIAGFSWGYEENQNKEVKIYPLQELTEHEWLQDYEKIRSR